MSEPVRDPARTAGAPAPSDLPRQIPSLAAWIRALDPGDLDEKTLEAWAREADRLAAESAHKDGLLREAMAADEALTPAIDLYQARRLLRDWRDAIGAGVLQALESRQRIAAADHLANLRERTASFLRERP